MNGNDDSKFMAEALIEAKKAADMDEVPIGAVIVQSGEIIARAHNLRETDKNPIAHAEMLAIQKAAASLGGWRLSGCTLYVTIEPCPMCAGAIIQSRIDRLVYGAPDVKAGCAGTLYNLLQDSRMNHQTEITSSVLRDDCADVISTYFKAKRAAQKSDSSAASET